MQWFIPTPAKIKCAFLYTRFLKKVIHIVFNFSGTYITICVHSSHVAASAIRPPTFVIRYTSRFGRILLTTQFIGADLSPRIYLSENYGRMHYYWPLFSQAKPDDLKGDFFRVPGRLRRSLIDKCVYMVYGPGLFRPSCSFI